MIATPLGLLAAGTAWGEWGVEDFKNPKARQEMAAASQRGRAAGETPCRVGTARLDVDRADARLRAAVSQKPAARLHPFGDVRRRLILLAWLASGWLPRVCVRSRNPLDRGNSGLKQRPQGFSKETSPGWPTRSTTPRWPTTPRGAAAGCKRSTRARRSSASGCSSSPPSARGSLAAVFGRAARGGGAGARVARAAAHAGEPGLGRRAGVHRVDRAARDFPDARRAARRAAGSGLDGHRARVARRRAAALRGRKPRRRSR